MQIERPAPQSRIQQLVNILKNAWKRVVPSCEGDQDAGHVASMRAKQYSI
jgi:hypothetical protein